LLWWREANMSLYYVLLRIWLGLSGGYKQSPFFIRASPCCLSARYRCWHIYWSSTLLYDRRVGLIAAASFALERVQRSLRSGGAQLLAFLAAGDDVVRLPDCLLESAFAPHPARLRRGQHSRGLCALLRVLLLPVQWLAVEVRHGAGKVERGGAQEFAQMRRAWVIIGIAVLPLLIFVAKTGAGPIRWIQRPGLRGVLEFYRNMAGGNSWALLGICALACSLRLQQVGKNCSHAPRVADLESSTSPDLAFLPSVVDGLAVVRTPVFLGRYMIFCLPALVILTAAGLARLRQSWLLTAALIGVLFLEFAGSFFRLRSRTSITSGTPQEPQQTLFSIIPSQAMPSSFISRERALLMNSFVRCGPEQILQARISQLSWDQRFSFPSMELDSTIVISRASLPQICCARWGNRIRAYG